MVLTGLTVLLAAILGSVAYATLRTLPGRPALASEMTRENRVGIVLAFVCLAWGAHYGCLMLEGGMAAFKPLLILGVPVLTVLSYRYLDYIVTRAICALVILTINVVLQEAFAMRLPGRAVFAVMCYGLGILTMYLVALPWHLREWLEKTSGSTTFRARVSAVAVAGCAGFLVFAVLGLL